MDTAISGKPIDRAVYSYVRFRRPGIAGSFPTIK